MSADTGRGSRVLAGRYALTDVLGRGGMGTVWLADDRMLQRQVAVKEMTFSIHLTDEERGILRERTLREARAAARLDHPHATSVYDVVEEDGKPWLVMEHVPARSLQQLLEQDGPLPPPAVARIGLDVLAALDAAHRAGIVHRDVKPSNVLVNGAGRAYLTDFGIATTTGDSSLTTHGALLGSPSYMAPERAQGEEPRPPVDLWSLGATLYAAVEGKPPFDRGEAMATLMSAVSEDPAPMVRAGPLAPVLLGLLTKDPDRRSTADQAREQLEAVVSGRAPAPADPAPDGRPSPAPATDQAPGHPAGRLRRDSVERLDAEDLLALASASKAILRSVARDARDEARHLAEKHRQKRRKEQLAAQAAGTPAPEAPPAEAPAAEAPAAAAPARRRGGRRPSRAPEPPAPEPSRRLRFKRRWVVVPVLMALLVSVLIIGGLAALIAMAFGLI